MSNETAFSYNECMSQLNKCRQSDDDCNNTQYKDFFQFICKSFYSNTKLSDKPCCIPNDHEELKGNAMCDLIIMITNHENNRSLAILTECHKYSTDKINKSIFERNIKKLLNKYLPGLDMLINSNSNIEKACNELTDKISQLPNLTNKINALNNCKDFLDNNLFKFKNYKKGPLVKCSIFSFINGNLLLKSSYKKFFEILQGYLKIH